jgi:hypothetical protein
MSRPLANVVILSERSESKDPCSGNDPTPLAAGPKPCSPYKANMTILNR